MLKKFPDSHFTGIIIGLLSMILFYFLLAYIRHIIVNHYQNQYMLMAPKVQLFAIFLNVLFFRFVMVSLNKEKSGKGILLATIAASSAYFYFWFRYNISIIGS